MLQTSRQVEVTKARPEINEIEQTKIIQRTNGTKSWFFEKFHKFDKPLVKLTKTERSSKLIKLKMKMETLKQILRKCRD